MFGARRETMTTGRNSAAVVGRSRMCCVTPEIENNTSMGTEYHGIGGPLQVEDLSETYPILDAFIDAAEGGYPKNNDYNGASQEGFGYYQVTKKGRRYSVSRAFLDPVRGRDNLKVETDAFARKVILEGKKAVGIEYDVHGFPRSPARKESSCIAAPFNRRKF